MQTFLTSSSYRKSAEVLDDRRLRKQTWECKQIIDAIIANRNGEKRGWQNHCITRMWQNHPHSLLYYWCAMVEECARREENHLEHTLGIHGLWLAGGNDRFSHYEDDKFIGIEYHNCCGYGVVAVEK